MSWLETKRGNIIATVPDKDGAEDIMTFDFADGCVVMFGNEFHGLPTDIMDLADSKAVIPMRGKAYPRPDSTGKIVGIGKQRCLGLSACVPIVLFHALNKMGVYHGWNGT